MRVLIGCERSGIVRRAFRERGHDAWSCDIVPADDGSEFHLCADVLSVLGDGWDLGMFFPPCTYLTRSGAQWLKDGAKARPGILTGAARREAQKKAFALVLALWNAPIKRVGIENPRGILTTLWRKPSQVIHPHQFGHPECKATALWLRRLPPLRPTRDVKAIMQELPKRLQQKRFYLPQSPDRARLRSEMYPGIAAAMAETWGAL